MEEQEIILASFFEIDNFRERAVNYLTKCPWEEQRTLVHLFQEKVQMPQMEVLIAADGYVPELMDVIIADVPAGELQTSLYILLKEYYYDKTTVKQYNNINMFLL